MGAVPAASTTPATSNNKAKREDLTLPGLHMANRRSGWLHDLPFVREADGAAQAWAARVVAGG